MGAKINRDMTWGAERGAGGTVTPQEELTQKMWQAMEEVICPAECSIYSYRPEGEMDPLSTEGKVRFVSRTPHSAHPPSACTMLARARGGLRIILTRACAFHRLVWVVWL